MTDHSSGPSADDADVLPSKSQRKREAAALRDLGAQLVELGAGQLDRFPLSDGLRTAIADYHRIRSREARRRQLQYIGKLLRTEDHAAIADRFADLTADAAASSARHHRIERWREQLIADDGALTAFLAENPDFDRQQLRQLIRKARQDRDRERNTGAARQLFRLLRDTLDGESAD